jgi:hypothetical protein
VRRITSFALGCYQRVSILADSNSFSTGMQSIDVSGWKATNGVLTKRHERIVRLVMHTLTLTISPMRAEVPVEMLDGESTALFRRKKYPSFPLSSQQRFTCSTVLADHVGKRGRMRVCDVWCVRTLDRKNDSDS